MILGAMVDAGLDLEQLRQALVSLPLEGYRLEAERVDRAGLAATHVEVVLAPGDQPQRRLVDIEAIIAQSDLPADDRHRAIKVFRCLAEAEATVHGIAIGDVHFHEVGAVDAIVDIVGTVAGLRLLAVDQCYASPLPAGSGAVRSAHGQLPVPAPATLELLARARAPLRPNDGERGELVTPTGAALLTALARFERPALSLESVGYGAGGRNPPEAPNVLRLWLGQEQTASGRQLLQIETNIDDMQPEFYSYVQELLFAAGALDVWLTPVQMKKNRPAVVLSALCRSDAEDGIVDVLFRETSTLGMRVHEVRRHEADRVSYRFSSSLGEADIKVKLLPGEPPRVAPEFESCRDLALTSGRPLAEVYQMLQQEGAAWLAFQNVRQEEGSRP